MAAKPADFGGYATKAGLKCSDGRTIMADAFKHMDGEKIPLVWQHVHNDPDNILGHAVLEARSDGMYAYGYFNSTPKAQSAKAAVQHEDVNHMSIFANQLVEKQKQVFHGQIREVSLVLAGANPGAKIDFINIQHGDGSIHESDEEAIITTGIDIELEHGESDENVESDDTEETDNDESDQSEEETDEGDVNEALQHAAAADDTVGDVIDTMTEEQKNAMYFVVGRMLEGAQGVQHSDNNSEGDLTHQEGADDMTSRNVFDQTKQDAAEETRKNVLTHDAMKGIFEDAEKRGSLKAAVEAYTKAELLQHGIESIDVLFPDAKMATGTIELDKRRTEWVSVVLNGTRHTPFARIKTFAADLKQDEARAKGYIKGNYKVEEWINVTRRTTSPTTIYKKQALDRDDMLDITDFDIVAFLKAEMRLMTEEEIARAILIGDGRAADDPDKVKDPLGATDGIGIRSILNDHELFVTTLYVNVDDASSSYEEVVDAVMDGMEYYKGSGTPAFFTTIPQLNKFLKARDGMQRRFYANKSEVADALGVSGIYNVEPMKEVSDLIGIIVSLDDYNVGTDRGGEITMFDDFDIDYNKQKYLMETRMSGALVRPKAAIVIKKTAASAQLLTPVKPAFNANTGVITIPTVANVTYKDSAGTTLSAGPQAALDPGQTSTITAVPASGYYFADNQSDDWAFTRKHA
jgi:HK97 family phage prohead protease